MSIHQLTDLTYQAIFAIRPYVRHVKKIEDEYWERDGRKEDDDLFSITSSSASESTDIEGVQTIDWPY